ncbi:hypothetical protein BH20BAC1_BH20BAC1_20010 [soil metagenome]
MKHTWLFILLTISLCAAAQTKTQGIKIANPLVADIEKVAKDYFENFAGILGEKISETTNTVEYTSNVTPQGALESTILQIKSLDNSYSWQAVMMTTENFAEAAKKYKELYHKLNGVHLTLQNRKVYQVQGAYDSPNESKSFASSLLEAKGLTENSQRFIVEVALNYLMPDWTVKLYVYEKEDDDAIRPTASSDY